MASREPSPAANAPSRLSLWGPVAVYCAMIFAFSSASSVPALPDGVSDKMAHALLYSGLGAVVARALSGGVSRPPSLPAVLAVLGFAAVYGLSDEVHQLFVPMRQFDPKDWSADVIGAGAGAGAWWLWGILRRTRDDA